MGTSENEFFRSTKASTRVLSAMMSAVILVIVSAPQAQAQAREIPDPGLRDIAVTSQDQFGPVVFYNPILCANVGQVICGFFRAHEYGHIVHGDVPLGNFPPAAEAAADCFAAANSSPMQLNMVITFFQQMGPNGDPVHGTGFQRARRIADMATTGNCHF